MAVNPVHKTSLTCFTCTGEQLGLSVCEMSRIASRSAEIGILGRWGMCVVRRQTGC